MKIRLILADDHPALLSGIQHDLTAFQTLQVVGLAQDSGSLIDTLNHMQCDVLVTDYSMPGGAHGDGLAFLSLLKRSFPALKIVVFTVFDTPAIVQHIANLGVDAVINKSSETRYLVSAIHAVYAGAKYFPMNSLFEHDQVSGPASLSSRELEVVRLYISGMSVNEIASQLNRTKQTISCQKSSAMRKLGIERDADLFRYGYEAKLLTRSLVPLDRGVA